MKRAMSLAVVFALATLWVCSPSYAVKVGDKAPEFKAQGVDGKNYSLNQMKGADAVVICFTCNNCPVAKAYEDRFIEFARQYDKKNVKFIAINVNSTEDLAAMKERAEEKGFPFPYAYDASQESAKKYEAMVTPHMFVLDKNHAVAYVGAFDDSQREPKEHYVKDAVDSLLKGEKPAVSEKKAFGCGIKW